MKKYAISAGLVLCASFCMGDDWRGIALGLVMVAAAALMTFLAERDRSA